MYITEREREKNVLASNRMQVIGSRKIFKNGRNEGRCNTYLTHVLRHHRSVENQ